MGATDFFYLRVRCSLVLHRVRLASASKRALAAAYTRSSAASTKPRSADSSYWRSRPPTVEIGLCGPMWVGASSTGSIGAPCMSNAWKTQTESAQCCRTRDRARAATLRGMCSERERRRQRRPKGSRVHGVVGCIASAFAHLEHADKDEALVQHAHRRRDLGGARRTL